MSESPDTNETETASKNNIGIEQEEIAEFDKAMSNGVVDIPNLEIGQCMSASVIEVKKDYVLLDIGDKAEGVVELREFCDPKGNVNVKTGDQVDVVLIGRDNETGQLKMSHRQAKVISEKQRISKAFKEKTPVKGIVKKVTKDGLIVDIGLDCFMHRTQIDIKRIDKDLPLDEWLGKEVEAYVTQMSPDARDEKRTKISISRRRLMEAQAEEAAKEVMKTIEPDIIITGKVKKIEKFGVFVDLGGVDALVPQSEIAWERGVDVNEVLKPGYNYKFKVLSVEERENDKNGRKSRRISLSRKQIKPDPWLKITETYPLDSSVKAKVNGIAFNCAYVTLEDNTEGFIPREELSWGTSLKPVDSVLKKGDEVECKVIGYNDKKHHVKLSLKAVTKDPWDDIEKRYPVNSKQHGKVIEVVDYGAFVELDEFTKGLVYIGDFTYDPSDKRKPAEVLKIGDEIDVIILRIDKEQRRINLGIKQISGDPFKHYINEHKERTAVTGTVTEVIDAGLRIKLADNVFGFLRIRDWDTERTETLRGVVNVGDSVTAMISRIDKKKRDISLSRRDYIREEEKRDREAYSGQTSEKAVTHLGNLLSSLNIDLKK